MNVLLLGSGGREHTLAWKIAQSPLLNQLFIAPGNAGTTLCGQNLPVDPTDFEGVAKIIKEKKIQMVVVGPEAPLVAGLHDHLMAMEEFRDLMFIGPKKAGAMLEGSKDFAKEFMVRNHIPTAKYQTFTLQNIEAAYEYLTTLRPPFVIKADGLAAGKGVIICQESQEALRTIDEILKDKKFGTAGQKVVIEEFLNGIEMSVFVLTDGEDYLLLPEAKDYKRIDEGDRGPNTGGMGSVSPVPFADATLMKRIKEEIITPTIEGLKSAHIPYIGFIFFGLMICDGAPYVIEYNVRMGDPETESVIPRFKSDLLAAMVACSKGELASFNAEIDPRFATAVMLVSQGYPGAYEKGKLITMGTPPPDGLTFHAGTKLEQGKTLTAGGRVMAITALGKTLPEALKKTYNHIPSIHFEGKKYRKDIGKDLLK
ncbi:MAG: phosphoribosylamine--glycine ligase [Bacteroidetes bacterium]|nr:MAG: phosphoribosylamine--glycine ligase [Bacteroidota bacterium]